MRTTIFDVTINLAKHAADAAEALAFRQWFCRGRGRELTKEVFATVKETIVSHPGVTIAHEE